MQKNCSEIIRENPCNAWLILADELIDLRLVGVERIRHHEIAGGLDCDGIPVDQIGLAAVLEVADGAAAEAISDQVASQYESGRGTAAPGPATEPRHALRHAGIGQRPHAVPEFAGHRVGVAQ